MSVRRGLFVQLQVVHALVLRETRTRFGTHQLGYLWAVFEPVLWMLTLLGLFALGGRSAPTGLTIAGFLITGLVPYQLFRESFGRVSAAVKSNKGLLFYPQVLPLDLMLARILLEGATALSVFALLVGGEAMFLGTFRPDNLLFVLGGFLAALSLGGGLGMVFGSLSLVMPSLEKISGPVLRPMFWLSGIFYTANDVPMKLLEYIQYNPVLHCIEMVRQGWFPEYTSRHLSLAYPTMWGLVLIFFGLILERATRVRIELS